MHRLACTVLTLSICTGALATGFDENYEVRSGDYNSDGYMDLYVRQKPQIVLVPVGDILTPIVMKAPVEHFVLTQDYAQQTLSVTDVTTPISLTEWQPVSSVDVKVDDFNVDGAVDALLSGVSSVLSSIPDHMVFASVDAGVAPESATRVDDDFKHFFRDSYGWAANPNYIESTKVPTTTPSYLYAVVLDVNLCWDIGAFVQTCINGSDLLYATELTLVPDATVAQLPQLSDTSFFQSSANLLDSAINQTLIASPPVYGSSSPTYNGVIEGCYYYCEQDYGYYGGQYFSFSVYDVFVETTETLNYFDKENYSLNALQLSMAVGEALNDPDVALQTDESVAEQILEGVLDFGLGDTAAGFFASTLTMPKEIPPDFPTEELAKARRWPFPLPDAANDPDWFPKKKWKVIGAVIGRIGIVVCGLLICAEEAGENDDIFIWRNIGIENAIKQLAEEGYENYEQPRAVIGESEGTLDPSRIQDAASYYNAVYYKPDDIFDTAVFSLDTKKAAWRMNYGWLMVLMLRQSHVFDIGLYDDRSPRGEFYPCERSALTSHGNYPRQEVWWTDTLGFSVGSCGLW